MLKAGSLINDKYSIISFIRSDRFSSSYLAVYERANITYEVKFIPKIVQFDHTAIRQSPIVDPKHLVRLNHPHLQHVVEVIEDDDCYIFILTAIEGCLLTSILDDMGPQPESIVVPWACQLTDVLAYLHTRTPHIHCGHLKPSQIYLRPNGDIILADYYTAIEPLRSNHDIVCLGTSFNQVPERDNIDERTDIYYWGTTIFNILTGTNSSSIHSDLLQEIEDNTMLSTGVKSIISKCVQADPNYRFQSVHELSYAMNSYQCMAFKKSSRIKSLLKSINSSKKHRKTKRSSHLSVTDVQFSVIAPKRFVKGEYTVIDVFMHEDDYKYIVFSGKLNDLFDSTTSGYLRVEEGTSVSVQLTSPNVSIQNDTETLTWQGKYLRFQFLVYLDENYDKEQICFTAKVYFNSVIACRLEFIAKCISIRRQSLYIDRIDYRSAFISYASQDRNRVISIVRGMRKMRPDMEIFMDIDYLKSGDRWERVIKNEILNRDVLFLCWSQFASNSAWVDMEWRYALKNKGIDAIEPIPLESPLKCPPPKELEMKHFNDRELYYFTNEP